jgi:hypothetical protein
MKTEGWCCEQTCRLAAKLGIKVAAHFKPVGNVTLASDVILFVASDTIFSDLRSRFKSAAACESTRRGDTAADTRGAQGRAETHVNDGGNATLEMDVIALFERTRVLRFPNPCVRLRGREEEAEFQKTERDKTRPRHCD